MIKAVIFNYGGVIIKMVPAFKYANFLSRLYNLPKRIIKRKVSPFFILLQKGIISETEFYRRLSLALGKPIPKNAKGAWRRCVKDNFHLYPGIIRLVKKIKAKGIKTAILSNTIKSHIGVIKKPFIYKNFDVLIFSCRVGAKKPELKIYKILLQKLKVKPKECLFIDDTKENLKPARKLGMKVVLAKNPKQVIGDVQKILD